jgi:hypothetical protein
MRRYDYIIGIDPDAKASGVANLDVEGKKVIRCEVMKFPELINYVTREYSYASTMGASLIVIVEASWLKESASGNSHNWHIKEEDSKRVAAAKGAGVARNQETGRKIVEMLKYYGCDVVETYPLRKCWQGPDGKITQGEIEQFIPDFPKKSNQEVRDAALLAWNYAELPIRVKVQSKLK